MNEPQPSGDEATAEFYGNPNLPEGTEERPLVTFALFAYNQEKFIREAVEAALAQTYSPLEVILSDDCSADKTYETMRELATAYRGPHTVKLMRSEENLGLLKHVISRGRGARGAYIVMAAGDDISCTRRVDKHISTYAQTNADAISSAYRLIDRDGSIIDSYVRLPINVLKNKRRLLLFRETIDPYVVIQGATASYKSDLFKLEVPYGATSMSEDNWFNFIIYLYGGKVTFLDEALVQYRKHDAAMTNNRKSFQYDEAIERSALIAAEVERQKLSAFISLKKYSKDGVILNLIGIEKRIDELKIISSWGTLNTLSRARFLFWALRSRERHLIQWMALRLFGEFPRYQPRLYIQTMLKLFSR